MWKGAQFMTEKAGGSDVGAMETVAEHMGPNTLGLDEWKLSGDKRFCSHTDAEVVMILARPSGAGGGTKGLGLFAMPRWLPDGSRNSYRIARLKDKLAPARWRVVSYCSKAQPPTSWVISTADSPKWSSKSIFAGSLMALAPRP
jgi:alkylation response protein AidB-like acyl-CoA dehydrogenase